MTHHTALRASATLFAALYAVATFLPTLPEGSYSDAFVLTLVNADQLPVVLGGYALAVAGLVMFWFTSLVASRISAPHSTLTHLVAMGGGGYALTLMVASTFFGSLATGRAIGELPPAEDAFLVRALSNQGFHLVLVPGLLCAGLLILAVSLLARREALLPRWCVVFGFCLAPLLLLGAAWMPQFLVPLWAVVVAFAMKERPGLPQSPIAETSVSAAL